MDWKIAYAHQRDKGYKEYNTIEELEMSGFDIIPAQVPGNFELDLMRAGRIEDLYFSTNTLEAQKLEDVHVWYYTTLMITDPKQYLRFEGIDTIADIFVNGKLVMSVENMFLAYDVFADWVLGENEIVVHIKPAVLEARKYKIPMSFTAGRYNLAHLYVRKAPHMYGWDIMPRIVSAGLWKPVVLKKATTDTINEVYLMTNTVTIQEDGKARADLYAIVEANLEGDLATEYSMKVEGRCGTSIFSKTGRFWHNVHKVHINIDDCQLWWPKNAGDPNLYDVEVTLLRGDKVCDSYSLKFGVRTVELVRTDVTTQNGDGDFCFVVNGKRIFVMGTNWVPLDAFHSNDINRLPKAMEMISDIGCNMIRCWGGNVYESEEFYDYCDKHGIMVWQDFSMACAIYPNERAFEEKLEKEAIFQIKRLRNHSCIALWAGDNECDGAYRWEGILRDPNQNTLTRVVLKRAVDMHDFARPYLPSSPFISEAVHRGEGIMPENHLWGPRDYFKGDFYKNTFCHFASETGYHGFPSPNSLSRFLKEPEKIYDENGKVSDEYLVHASCMECTEGAEYAYRIPLAHSQVEILFGRSQDDLDVFVRKSQISQAEAKKYFIEKFRIGKGKRTGIIWWNLLDGWPQVSDAVVDYYYTKKLAYHYIKRSQEPVCLMFDEPENGKCKLVAVNDLPHKAEVSYSVKRIVENSQVAEVLYGKAFLEADSAAVINQMPVGADEKEFYLIEWNIGGKKFKNHYFTNIIDIDYCKYAEALKICGMDEFEGFKER